MNTRIVAALALVTLGPAPVRAQDALALSCPVCHGGGTVTPSAVPALDALSADAIAQSLRAFRDGARPGTAMPRLVAKLSDREIDALAAAYGGNGPSP